MSRKVKKWLKSYPSAGRLVKMNCRTLSLFVRGGWGMSIQVKKWLKSYPSAGRLVKMDFHIFSLFLHGGWG